MTVAIHDDKDKQTNRQRHRKTATYGRDRERNRKVGGVEEGETGKKRVGELEANGAFGVLLRQNECRFT